MTAASIIVAQPDRPQELVLLFHGVGSSAQNMTSVGQHIARARPHAMVVSVEAPHASGLGAGREWFSVLGVTEQNRPERIAQAMPSFVRSLEEWQQQSGVTPAQTTLVGFSQGAIMSCESTQLAASPAGRVVALAGRFATPVRQAPAGTRFHFIHGDSDPVVAPHFSIDAAEAIQRMNGVATLDLIAGLAHGIDGRMLQRMLAHLGG